MTKNAALGQFLTDVQSQMKSWISDGAPASGKVLLASSDQTGTQLSSRNTVVQERDYLICLLLPSSSTVLIHPELVKWN